MFFCYNISQANEYQRQAEVLAHNLADRNHALETLESEYNRLQTQFSETKSKLSSEAVSSTNIEISLSDMRAQLQLVSSEKETLASVVEGLRSELNDARRHRADALQNLDESISKFQRLEKYSESRKDSLDNLLKDFTETKQHNVKLRLQIDSLEDQVVIVMMAMFLTLFQSV